MVDRQALDAAPGRRQTGAMQTRPRELHCAVCGGARITPATATGVATDCTHLRYKTPEGGFLSQGIILFAVGRACLDCGHVMCFLSPESLERARRERALVPW